MNLTDAEEHNSFNHRKKASSATCDYRRESALPSGNLTYPGLRGPGTNNIVTDAKLKRQTETAAATRESSDIHRNTL